MTLKGRIWDLVEINAEVAAHLDDTAYSRWTTTQVDTAIKAAVRSAAHVWTEERIDTTHTYAINTQRYALPLTCESVLEVWFAPITANKPRKLVPISTWRVEDRNLVFQHVYNLYDTKQMYIYYVTHPANLLNVGAADLQQQSYDCYQSRGYEAVRRSFRWG